MRRSGWNHAALFLIVTALTVGDARASRPAVDACEVRYELLELGALGPSSNSSAWALNNRGHATGNTGTSDQRSTAFLWSCDAGMEDIGLSTGLRDMAGIALNERDQVIIYASVPPEMIPRSFLWDRHNGAVRFDPTRVFLPHTLTNGGLASDGVRVWTADEGVRPLELGIQIIDSRPTNFGRIGGTMLAEDQENARVFTWTQRDGVKDLGPWPTQSTLTLDINDRGDLLLQDDDLRTAAIVDRFGNVVRLTLSADVLNVSAVALNVQREVVGFMLKTHTEPPGRSSRSFIWDSARGYRDLDALLFGTTTGQSRFNPSGINDWGWISGDVDFRVASLAIPVPAHVRRFENLQRLHGPQLCRAFNEIKVHRLLCSLQH